jgi:putative ABC transport system ATP-binding protein
MSTSVLEAQRLCKRFKNAGTELLVLDQVSFSLWPGSTCAIVGPSGSGKTTLLGLCAGLDLPTSGTVLIDGQDLSKLNEDERARLRNERIGFVFQNFQLIPTLTALENVMVPLELRGSGPARGPAVALLEQVGLGERLGHYAVQLSGGEQQRVALARAFVNRPKILFADEPTGNLDAETGHRIVEALFELNASFGTTLILITHDVELAQRAGVIIRLKAGRITDCETASSRPEPAGTDVPCSAR